MLEVIILAAGQGSRMQSKLPKVLHSVVWSAVNSLHPRCRARSWSATVSMSSLVVVPMRWKRPFRAPDVQCHLQAEQKGTGHAVQQAIGAVHPESTYWCCLVMSRWSVTRLAGGGDRS